MALSKHAKLDSLGYEDDRFEDIVSENFHCIICTNVFKDPVMCRRNEHIFCRNCITRHLANSQTCPTCMEKLTIETLRVPPRIVIGCLEEFKIRCDFYSRGCRHIVQLGKLKKHVSECDFAPVKCSNEGCEMEVNKRDLTHHETVICERRQGLCHNCVDLKQDMESVKKKLTTFNSKLLGIETKVAKEFSDVNTKVDKQFFEVNSKLDQLELTAKQLQADNMEIKKNLVVVIEQLGILSGATLNEACAAQTSVVNDSNPKTVPSPQTRREPTQVKAGPKIIIAGGSRTQAGGWISKEQEVCLSSVEMYDPIRGMWTTLKSMRECRRDASSVVYNNEILISGGWLKSKGTTSMETLPIPNQDAPAVTGKMFPASLPHPFSGHRTVVHNDRLIVAGGYGFTCGSSYDMSRHIFSVNLVAPYSSKQLPRMKDKRMSFCLHMINGKLVALGGENFYYTLDSVSLYDLATNVCTELAPLPYKVSEMASVSWGGNVMIIGGAGERGSKRVVFDDVVVYNVTSQRSHRLPKMNEKRRGAAAAMIGSIVYVMGGTNERGEELKSVECFNIITNSWMKLPPMSVERYQATAVAC